MIGRTLAHYRITAAIGAGGMGEVYRATDTKLGREVALKVLPTKMAQDPEMLERFRREAKALAALDHAGIVTVYSVEEAEGVQFLTMQLIEGESLKKSIPEGGMPAETLLAIGTALAEALAAAHDRGIVHRDLKPANVMVTADGRVKVLDFGLAKMTGGEHPAVTDPAMATDVHTLDGVVFGTVPYMSPEQVSGLRVDHRTDIFSLGILLYEMAAGRRPFAGRSSAELASAILRDTPPDLGAARPDLPDSLREVISRCLRKDPGDRFPSAREAALALRDPGSGPMLLTVTTVKGASLQGAPSGPKRRDEGFWVAVLPFKHRSSDHVVEALAEGMSEDIVTGLARFPYLRVISRSSTLKYAGQAVDVRDFGKEVGARYVMEGTLRHAGSVLRIAVQLIDAESGAHLWAENYHRTFEPDRIFELQDELVPEIVSTVADMNGVLAHSMSEELRGRGPDELSPQEAVLRSFGYIERLTNEEHAEVRDCLERAVEQAPGNADCWAMLAFVYAEEHKHGFNVKPDPLGRSLAAARRAVEAAPSSNIAYHMLAQALFFRRELGAFRNAADRAVALNPMDGGTTAFMGILMAYAGDWERGCALTQRAMELNPHHPGWYRFASCFNAYRKRDYRAALDVALKFNMPSYFYTHAALASIYGQLGEREAAGGALRELLAQKPDFAQIAREEWGKWFGPGELLEHTLDGVRKAGLDIPGPAESTPSSASARESSPVAIAVLPFADLSPAKDQDYLCEGMAEEIRNALVGVEGIRVASRSSALRARHDEKDLAGIGRMLSVDHVLEGSVRTAGQRLRVTAQLSEVSTGYQLWSERFDREVEDIFSVQDDIARGVVDAVKARLAPGVLRVRDRAQARNFEAYRSYLLAQHLRYAKEDHGGAVRAFQEAVRLDPAHAPSWTGLAEALALTAHTSVIPASEACARAREALAKAMELQGESADGFLGEAWLAFIERRWKDMDAAARRAIELQPDHVSALGLVGMCLSLHQKPEEAAPFFERAREADPLASFPYMLSALGLLTVRRHQEAHHFAEQALVFEKDDASALFCSALASVALGRFEQGIAAAEHGVAVAHRGGDFVGLLGWALATAGRKDDARILLEELRARPAEAPQIASEGWLLAALGEFDAAFDVFKRAEEQNQLWLYYSGVPGFDPVRADPRFAALLARLGLPTG